MSLFVGNVSKKVTQKEFEEAFKSYGPCKVDLRKRFAFVQYYNERIAEQAKKNLQNKNFCGLRLNIEWSKNSGRFSENNKTQINQNNMRIYNYNRRSRSRQEKNWRRGNDKWSRRSPSQEKRNSPSYSENQDVQIQKVEVKCPRDQELLNILLQRKLKKLKQQQQRKKQAQLDGQILPDAEIIEEDKGQQQQII